MSGLQHIRHHISTTRTCASLYQTCSRHPLLKHRLKKMTELSTNQQILLITSQARTLSSKCFPTCTQRDSANLKYSTFPVLSRSSSTVLPTFSVCLQTNTKTGFLARSCYEIIRKSSLRSCSQYVAGMRYLEKLKEKDELCGEVVKTGQFAIFCDLKAMVRMDELASKRLKLVWRGAEEMEEVLALVDGMKLTDAVLLNSSSKNPSEPARFAFNIPLADDAVQQALESLLDAKSIGIRRAIFGVSRLDATELLQAYAILQWHSLQAFCSKCGSQNKKNMSGSRRICTNCSEIHYPTMKPIVITLVTDGERCLVARQPQFPEGMYSALAGFCDMGETLEDAVRREVAEEVGLEVADIAYSSSQHWPIPSSGLMLGCHAALKPGSHQAMAVDKNELEDAKWLSRHEVRDILEGSPGQGSMWLPPKQAIAHHLIRGWAFSD